MSDAMLEQATAEDGRVASDYRLGFSSQDTELDPVDLPVEGSIPAWLDGALVRNGPAKYEVGDGGFNHWFDGHAMLHRFAFGGGSVKYSNRFLRTRAFESAQNEGRISLQEFGTDPCRSIFRRFSSLFAPGASLTDNASVNLVRLGDRFLALTETPLPVEFDPRTLETLGVPEYADGLGGQITTAHPHRDPVTGHLVNYTAKLGPRSSYRVYRQPPGAAGRTLIADIPVKRPAYMHSFGITERFVVLVEFPLVVNPASLALSGKPFIENYQWEPERGARFNVIDLKDGTLRATVQAEAFFAFHHINAYEDGDALVVDISAYEDASIIDALYLERVRRPDTPLPPVLPRRYRVPLDGSDASHETLAGESLELPTIDYARRNGRRHRYAYGIGASGTSVSAFGSRLVKLDSDTGNTRIWAEDGCHAGEPVFVAEPGAAGEDEGVALSVVLDTHKGTSFLLALDARSWEELGRAEVPQHVPFGFHGQYLAGVR